MQLSQSLLLSAFIGAASALSDASVYIFQGNEWPKTSTPPNLTPEQARLVFAQRLGTSRYHNLGDADQRTLAYINTFGGDGNSLFHDLGKDKALELVLIVEGVSSNTAKPLLEAWSSLMPAFTISTPPSLSANKRLVDDLDQQCGQASKTCALEDAVNPLNAECWNGKSKIVHFDLGDAKSNSKIKELMSVQERLTLSAKKQELNVVIVLMPAESRSSRTKANAYGSYVKISQVEIARRSKLSEEPMTEDPTVETSPLYHSKQIQTSQASGNTTMKPITGIPRVCHASLDSCISATNNCSGHGECYKKHGEGQGGCFTCLCKATRKTVPFTDNQRNGTAWQYWGGSACQKQDVSSAFWLIFLSTVAIVGVTGWAISMLYSIGEEKLPGVIGAGVFSKSK